MRSTYMRGLLLAGAALGQGSFAARAMAQSDQALLPPVVITGTKLEATARQADGASSVASGQRLEDAGVVRTDELGKIFPELSVLPRSSRVYSLFSMRGVPSIDFYNPAVTVYVDGVPQDMAYFAQAMPEVEQVELLKGPQGTLYGRSSTGGVINIVTKKPGNLSQGRVVLDVNNLLRRTELSFGGAVVPNLWYADATLYADERPGVLSNRLTGADRLDSAHETLGRARLRWTPLDGRLDAMLSVSRDRFVSHEEYFQPYDLTDRHAVAPTPFDFVTPRIARNVNSAALHIDYQLPGWKLSSVSSYQQREFQRVLSTGNADPETQKTVYQELRLATSGDGVAAPRAVDGVLGASYEKQEFDRTRGTAFAAIPAFLYSGPSRGVTNSTSAALFGEAVWHVVPRLDLTAGLRYSSDRSDIDFHRTGAAALDFSGRQSDHRLSTKLAAGYTLAPGWRVHGLVSEGYKPGGFNRIADTAAGSIPYQAETLRNYELGFTADLPAQRLQFDGALFRSDTRHLQAPVTSTIYQILSNVGDARASGLELNAAYAATPDLTLRGGITWVDSSIRNYSAPVGNADLNGKHVPYVAPLGARASSEWRFRGPDGRQWRWQTGLTVSGDMYFDASNQFRQPAYALLDTALVWEWRKGTTVTAYVNNVGDRMVRNYAFSFGPLGNFAQYAPGRAAGVRLQVAL